MQNLRKKKVRVPKYLSLVLKKLALNVLLTCRYKFRPRFLRDVSNRDLSTTILGHQIAFPVCISPTAMNRMAHPDGELASAKGIWR